MIDTPDTPETDAASIEDADPTIDRPDVDAGSGNDDGAPDGDATHEPGSRDPLDHDGDGRKGGTAPAPALQNLVVTKDSAKWGVSHGEVIAVTPDQAKSLLSAGVARNAQAEEVELAQPRIRRWRQPD